MLERASLIIKKLQQMVDDNANAEMLLTISQMLVAELQQIQDVNTPKSVSITMPRKTFIVNEVPKLEEVFVEQTKLTMEVKHDEPVIQTIIPVVDSSAEIFEDTVIVTKEIEDVLPESPQLITWFMQEQEVPQIEVKNEGSILELPEEPDTEIIEEAVVTPAHLEQPLESTSNDYLFDTPAQIPTLPDIDLLTDSIPSPIPIEEGEVNNRFKEHKVEVAHLLENTHIKDLRKAISINDKYLFINDLFGGDESLYDRSIKQIQSYSILPEATFWIQRELKIKLNWSADNEVVQLFDQLVRRRFS